MDWMADHSLSVFEIDVFNPPKLNLLFLRAVISVFQKDQWKVIWKRLQHSETSMTRDDDCMNCSYSFGDKTLKEWAKWFQPKWWSSFAIESNESASCMILSWNSFHSSTIILFPPLSTVDEWMSPSFLYKWWRTERTNTSEEIEAYSSRLLLSIIGQSLFYEEDDAVSSPEFAFSWSFHSVHSFIRCQSVTRHGWVCFRSSVPRVLIYYWSFFLQQAKNKPSHDHWSRPVFSLGWHTWIPSRIMFSSCLRVPFIFVGITSPILVSS